MSVPPLPFPHTGVSAAASGPRQVLIPYAAMTGTDWSRQGQPLQLPHLDALLAMLSPASTLEGEDSDPMSPHERMAALWQGWDSLAAVPDAALPWAALAAASHPAFSAGGAPSGSWAFLTPCHWAVGADQIRMDNPADLQLSEAGSRALLALLAPWFAEDGFHLHYEQPGRWLVHSTAPGPMRNPSLERVLLRDIRHWIPAAGENRTLQRLHSEVQMLLYTHPFNDERAARGLPPVNAFWLHGTGTLPATTTPPASPCPEVWEALRTPALTGDRHSWLEAWSALDAGPMTGLLQHVKAGGSATLALCGERSARSFTTASRSLSQRVRSLFAPQRFTSMREAL